MVNDKNNSKKIILNMLRESSSSVSGQQISEILQTSRVAVWKQINSLRDLGYKIESSSTGYTLNEDPDEDHLYSWEFDLQKPHYHTYKELNSTMDAARKQALQGCDGFTTIIAEKQNEGKGRGRKKWISNEGGLYFTSVIHPDLPSAYSYIYTLAATASICAVFDELYNLQVRAKWPNDVIFKQKKLSGVLTEIHMTGDSMKWLNLGVGINVNNTPGLAHSSSILAITGLRHDRKELLTAFEKKYKDIISTHNPSDIRSLWKKYAQGINEYINLKTVSGAVIKGNLEGIDASGALLIRNSNNKIEQALYGDHYI